ncbi:uncharacterized protein prkg2l isoform X1 [Festucalex cinctus]
MRQDLKRWRRAEHQEKEALSELSSDLRKNLLQLQRAEVTRRRQKEKCQQTNSFFNNPFRYTSALLGQPKSGRLACSKEEVEEAVKAAHSDPSRDLPLGKCPFPIPKLNPSVPFNMADFTFEEVRSVVKRARAGSAPGQSGTSYKIYKNCPQLLRRLATLLRTLWKKKQEPLLWTLAEGCLIPKDLNSSSLEQFREISLLDIEGKVFWAIIARRLTSYLLANGYIDASVQKGGVPGYSGCLEHTVVISQIIKEVKSQKKTLSVVWLDLAKAYPNVPHQLICKALEQYQVRSEVIQLVMSHMGSLQMSFSVQDFTTKWQRLEKGIMAGCTISVSLFVAAMNLLLKAGESQCKGPTALDDTRHPACRAFMDDITVMTPFILGTRWVLSALEKMATWARMQFKPGKSRSLCILKGNLSNNTFSIQGSEIPTIHEKRIRCLGKSYDSTLKDRANLEDTAAQLKEWLSRVDRSLLLGRFKVWCFEHGIIPRLQWPFLLYDFPMTRVEAMERVCSRSIRKWLGVPPAFSSVNLNSRSSALRLPCSSVIEEFKATKARAACTLLVSRDTKVRHASSAINCGRKWKPLEAVKEAEAYWRHQEIVGTVCRGRLGLGNYTVKNWSKTNTRDRRDLVVRRVREAAEEDRRVKAAWLGTQARWMQWEGALERPLSWKEIWGTDQNKLGFLLRAVADLLPTPSNLKIWGKEEEASCNHCGASLCTLNHILTSCPKALAGGRYRWRHDKVLTEVAKWVELQRSHTSKQPPVPPRLTSFQPEGSKVPKGRRSDHRPSMLHRASDWELRVDLKKKLVFPQEVVATTLRPDMILLSRSSKSIILAELTVPWEDRLAISHQAKKAKYQDIVDEATLAGWHTTLFPIEVGARGPPPHQCAVSCRGSDLSPNKYRRLSGR